MNEEDKARFKAALESPDFQEKMYPHLGQKIWRLVREAQAIRYALPPDVFPRPKQKDDKQKDDQDVV